MSSSRATTLWARAAIDELVRLGVEELVLAPGSRSTPLVMAAADHSGLRIIPHLDERSAAFLGLGIGKASGRPAAVLTTSGTAVANLFPAVVEAYQSGVPLLLLTADRPPELRGTDANQTIDQHRIFGRYAVGFFDAGMPVPSETDRVREVVRDAVAHSIAPPGGPVHLNFPFAKPLEPESAVGDQDAWDHSRDPSTPEIRASGDGVSDASADTLLERLRSARRPLLVIGPSVESDPVRRRAAADACAALGSLLGAPLLADPLSGARHGGETDVVQASSYDLFLRDERTASDLAPDLIVRVGPTPTSAPLAAYLKRHGDVHQIQIGEGRRTHDHLSVVDTRLPDEAGGLFYAVVSAITKEPEAFGADGAWAERWRQVDAVSRSALTEAMSDPGFEGAIMAAVVESIREDVTLFVSSSMPVRDADGYGAPRPWPLEIFGNRGASGIDGIVSTALGVAIQGTGRPVVAVVGDIAMIHDGNGLLPVRTLDPDLTIVVIHNDGGGIFHMLPIRDFEPAFTPYFATPHGVDVRHLAEMHGVPFERVDTLGALREAVSATRPGSGARMVEIRTDRAYNRAARERVVERVREALGGLNSRG